jgi:Ca2+-binding EF-hand superfamily protein
MMLTEMTDEILQSFGRFFLINFTLIVSDRDRDGYLSIEEFAHLPEGVVDDPQMDQEYAEARRHEFQTQIDKNGDGKASRDELRAYVDPLSEYHSEEEVREIFEFADENKDGYLTLPELQKRAEILLSSGFIHPQSRLHDDL